jgi:hypothetical protein
VANSGRTAKQASLPLPSLEPIKTLPPAQTQPKEAKPPQAQQPAAAVQKSASAKSVKAPAPAPVAVLAPFVPTSGASAEKNFCDWCLHELSAHKMDIDAPTFVQFLMDMDSLDSVAEFIYLYLGHSVRATQFKQEFVRRRADLKRGNFSAAPVVPAAAAAPASNDSAAGGGGKKKKAKAVPANHLLGLSVASASKPNRGEIEFVAK